eukprot:8188921-Pyramimonas_sp.AAC.1
MNEEPTLTPSGTLSNSANPWIVQFAQDLECYRGISGAETSSRSGAILVIRGRSFFSDSSDASHEFLQIDPSILRSAAFTDKRHWDRLLRLTPVSAAPQGDAH